MTTETRTITAHIPVELAEKLDKLAEQYDRSRGWIIKTALADYIDIEEYRLHATLEASAFAHAHPEKLISQESMEKWASTLMSRT